MKNSFVSPGVTLPAKSVTLPPVTYTHDIEIDGSMAAVDGATEKTTPIERSAALILRLLPISATWLVLAVGVSWAASTGAAMAACLFAGLTACTYAYLDHSDHKHSRNGLERHRVDTYASLKRDEMSHQQELRKMALTAHLKMLGVDSER